MLQYSPDRSSAGWNLLAEKVHLLRGKSELVGSGVWSVQQSANAVCPGPSSIADQTVEQNPVLFPKSQAAPPSLCDPSLFVTWFLRTGHAGPPRSPLFRWLRAPPRPFSTEALWQRRVPPCPKRSPRSEQPWHLHIEKLGAINDRRCMARARRSSEHQRSRLSIVGRARTSPGAQITRRPTRGRCGSRSSAARRVRTPEYSRHAA
jgi:hypothetical protein